MTSRTSTPDSAGRSSRPSRLRRARRSGSVTEAVVVTRLLRMRATSQTSRSNSYASSRDLLPGQKHEHVLEVRGTPVALGRAAVGGVLQAQDGDRGPGAARAHP